MLPPQPLDHPETTGGSWSRYAIIYNLFVRTTLAFDHNADGLLAPPSSTTLSESGTFAKAILLLPYIQSLGCNTIHLLPITKIGRDGNKGNAGSPYAIRNPYQIEDSLCEPFLELGAEAEFDAFVSAAHHLGIRIVLEFVFRTASKDADLVPHHPEWFYWINADTPDRQTGTAEESAYGMPLFTNEEVKNIKEKVERDDFTDLLPPHPIYQEMFLPPPSPDMVSLKNGSWIADYGNGIKGRIPGAFADWPVDDGQPPWGDVTYLRLYDDPAFNYIAYNTIRMYDDALAIPQNRKTELWEYIANIIPHYQTKFGIDGAMIDMGHALPLALKQAIVNQARLIDPNFALWDENFATEEKSVKEGYNAVMGSTLFILARPAEIPKFIRRLAEQTTPIRAFGAIENHNTPRAMSRKGGLPSALMGISISAFLPTLPFIHSGAELGETFPINTGLDFEADEIAQLPSEELPLFSFRAIDWESGNSVILQHWQKTLQLRQNHVDLFSETNAETIEFISSEDPSVFAILRRKTDWSTKFALVVNHDLAASHSVWIPLPSGREQIVDLYTNQSFTASNAWFHFELAPGQTCWLEL